MNHPVTKKTSVTGLQLNSDKTSISLDLTQVSASEHFFFANAFMVKKEGGQIFCVFGGSSRFKTSIVFDRAVEIVLPIDAARSFLVVNVWDAPSSSGVGTFIQSLMTEVARVGALNTEVPISSQVTYGMPENPDNLRMFPSNVAIPSFAAGQAMLEFFEAAPGVIANLMAGRMARPNDGVSNLLAVIMDPKTLYEFLEKLKIELGFKPV